MAKESINNACDCAPQRRLDGLPFDIKDRILSVLDSPRDLLSFALTSKDWKSAIIPYHLQYRDLQIHCYSGKAYGAYKELNASVWKHLADRRDLSKNIRRIRLMSRADIERRERYPTTLLVPEEAEGAEVENGWDEDSPGAHPDVLRALTNIRSLKSFTWISAPGHSLLSEGIFEALGPCSTLVELRLGEISPKLDHLSPSASLWKLQLSNLTTLALRGPMWTALDGVEAPSFIGMMNGAFNLDDLTYSYTTSSFMLTPCTFPRLKRLHLFIGKGYSWHTATLRPVLDPDQAIIDFLERHTTIEELRWYPASPSAALPKGYLPSLKRIFSHHRLATGVLRDPTLQKERAMEVVSQISLGQNTLQHLEHIDGHRLEELHIWRFGELDDISSLARLFPTIKALEIPSFGIASGVKNYTIDECIECLASFPALESVRDCKIWLAIQATGGKRKDEAATRLATRCPNLKRINHWIDSPGAEIDIVFERDGNVVTWKEERTPKEWV